MNKGLAFTIVFAIILVGNIILAFWNYQQGDTLEFYLSTIIVILVILWYGVASRGQKKQ